MDSSSVAPTDWAFCSPDGNVKLFGSLADPSAELVDGALFHLAPGGLSIVSLPSFSQGRGGGPRARRVGGVMATLRTDVGKDGPVPGLFAVCPIRLPLGSRGTVRVWPHHPHWALGVGPEREERSRSGQPTRSCPT